MPCSGRGVPASKAIQCSSRTSTALGAASGLTRDEDGLSAGAKGAEFFLEPELSDPAGDTAGADFPARLARFLGDHGGRGSGVEEALTGHLAHDFVAAPVVALGARWWLSRAAAAPGR